MADIEQLLWQERVADQLRRGSLTDVKVELRKGLHHVVGCYENSEGNVVCDSFARYSKPKFAEEAMRTIKRMAALN